MGAETFRKFEEKMQAIETNSENYILGYQKDLSYYPGTTAIQQQVNRIVAVQRAERAAGRDLLQI